MKCDICKADIEELALSKIKGTIVKINELGKNKTFHVCSACQHKFKNKIKEEVSKIA